MAEVVPDEVPPEAAEAADTLSAAIAVAERLPAHLKNDLVEAARVAFAHSLDLTAAVCASLLMTTAIASVLVLRRAQRGAEAAREG